MKRELPSNDFCHDISLLDSGKQENALRAAVLSSSSFFSKSLSLTRLETRIAELSLTASVWVDKAQNTQWKQDLGDLTSLGELKSTLFFFTLSRQLQSRKAVNFCWVGWSREKSWWRSDRMLTCKLLRKLGKRGERLIELPSCWFQLKFLSG